ncbi:MAG: hypothetical protein Q7U73_00535 [Rubrivivax sp.]|nr:hypothetical protein [Rubrivivax sp.]
MNPLPKSFPAVDPAARVACVGAAAVCAAAVNIGLFGLFHAAASGPWIDATPEVLQSLAACDGLVDRDARTRCARELVTRVAASRARGTEVAAR